jgi:hypothetical protein
MKNLLKLFGMQTRLLSSAVCAVTFATVIGFTFAALSLTGCDNGGGGGTETLTYKGKGATNTYTLTIAKTAARAFTPIAGDQFKLTDGTDESRGTVVSFNENNSTFTLKPSKGASTFEAEISKKDLIRLSGTITFSKKGEVYISETLTPVTPGGGGGGGGDLWTWTLVNDSKFEDNDYICEIIYANGKFFAAGAKAKIVYSDDGITWTAVQDSKLGTIGTIEALCYGGPAGQEKFLASTSVSLSYSTDGITWTSTLTDNPSSSSTSSSQVFRTIIRSIVWGKDKFVGVGTYGRIGYSSDGIAWTQADVASIFDDTNVQHISYGGGKCVASDTYFKKMAYSTDGINWVKVMDEDVPPNIEGIAYGNGRFVAGDNVIIYSSDGINWTSVEDIKIQGFSGIIYGNGMFIAVSSSGVATSPNGETWTKVSNSPFDSNSRIYPNAVAYGNGKFVVVGTNGKIAYSSGLGGGGGGGQGTAPAITTSSLPGGTVGMAYNQTLAASGGAPITWSRDSGSLPGGLSLSSSGVISGTPTTAGTFNFTVKATNSAGSVTKELSINIASSGGVVTGNMTWITVETTAFDYKLLGITDANVYAIAYGGAAGQEKFVAAGSMGKIAYSSDGITWTAAVMDNSLYEIGQAIYAIAYGGGTFVAGGNGNMVTSTDGITWTAVSDKLSGIFDIAYGGGKFVAMNEYGGMEYSADGKNWTRVTEANNPFTTNYANGYGKIIYGGDRFVATVPNSQMAYSTDGVSWTAITTTVFDYQLFGEQLKGEISAIAYGNGTFVAGAAEILGGGKKAYSTDGGVTWKAITSPVFESRRITAITYADGKFFAGDENGNIASSPDGVTWTSIGEKVFGATQIGSVTASAIVSVGGRFVALRGYDHKLAYSWGLGGSQGAAPAITTTSLPGGTTGTAYSQKLAASGGAPIAWILESGSLPDGLFLSSDGAISGRPTTAKTFNFTVKAINGAGSSTAQALSLVIAQGSTEGGGTFTLTDIPSQYDGKYVYMSFEGNNALIVYGFEDMVKSTLPQISNGSVSIPLWMLDLSSPTKVSRYDGNDSLSLYESAIIDSQQVQGYKGKVTYWYPLVETIQFSDGNAARSWSQGSSYSENIK